MEYAPNIAGMSHDGIRAGVDHRMRGIKGGSKGSGLIDSQGDQRGQKGSGLIDSHIQNEASDENDDGSSDVALSKLLRLR